MPNSPDPKLIAELGVASLDPNSAPNRLCLGCQFITLARSIWTWASCAPVTLVSAEMLAALD